MIWNNDKEWQVGDDVVVNRHHSRTIKKIDRITNTQLIIGTHKFRRSDGWEIGGSTWSRSWLTIPDEKVLNEIKLEDKKSEVLTQLRNLCDNVNNLNNEQLDSILKVIKELQE